MYPLCIDTMDLTVGELQVVDTTNGSVNCAKIRQNELDIIGLVESDNVGSSYELVVSDVDIVSMNLEIKEKQMFMGKATLLALMGKYKIDKGFNFRVKRSDSKSNVLKCFSDECAWSMKA